MFESAYYWDVGIGYRIECIMPNWDGITWDKFSEELFLETSDLEVAFENDRPFGVAETPVMKITMSSKAVLGLGDLKLKNIFLGSTVPSSVYTVTESAGTGLASYSYDFQILPMWRVWKGTQLVYIGVQRQRGGFSYNEDTLEIEVYDFLSTFMRNIKIVDFGKLFLHRLLRLHRDESLYQETDVLQMLTADYAVRESWRAQDNSQVHTAWLFKLARLNQYVHELALAVLARHHGGGMPVEITLDKKIFLDWSSLVCCRWPHTARSGSSYNLFQAGDVGANIRIATVATASPLLNDYCYPDSKDLYMVGWISRQNWEIDHNYDAKQVYSGFFLDGRDPGCLADGVTMYDMLHNMTVGWLQKRVFKIVGNKLLVDNGTNGSLITVNLNNEVLAEGFQLESGALAGAVRSVTLNINSQNDKDLDEYRAVKEGNLSEEDIEYKMPVHTLPRIKNGWDNENSSIGRGPFAFATNAKGNWRQANFSISRLYYKDSNATNPLITTQVPELFIHALPYNPENPNLNIPAASPNGINDIMLKIQADKTNWVWTIVQDRLSVYSGTYRKATIKTEKISVNDLLSLAVLVFSGERKYLINPMAGVGDVTLITTVVNIKQSVIGGVSEVILLGVI